MVTTRSQSKRHAEQEASPEPKPKVYDFSRLFSKHLKGLANAKTPDLEVHIGNEIFKVHKIILATGNDVFKAMFDSRMVESKNNSLEIKDCDPAAFRVFLSHLYSYQVRSKDVSLDLLMVAEKYLDNPLKKRCFEVLVDGISIDNILETAQVASQFNYENLIVACQKFVTENFAKLKGTPLLGALLENKELVFEIVQGSNELLEETRTHKFVLDGLSYLLVSRCRQCDAFETRCRCRNKLYDSRALRPRVPSVKFFFKNIEWSIKVALEDRQSNRVGINLMAKNKLVRANVQLTVQSEDPKFSNIVFELKKKPFGKHFFKVLDSRNDKSDEYKAYAGRGGFHVVLVIKVLSSEDRLNVADDSSETDSVSSWSNTSDTSESEDPEDDSETDEANIFEPVFRHFFIQRM